MIIGRKKEMAELQEAINSQYSEFVAVYGRRRVGKTFLIREFFNNKFTFQHSGLANSDFKQQLMAWKSSLSDYGVKVRATPKSWIDAFDLLKDLIRNSNEPKKIIFIDEMPWMDTKRSEFLPALEFFWNGWASARKDIVLIICGSATSWIINKVIKNHGGLHNRITHRIHLQQFTLSECMQYAQDRKLGMTQKQILETYMIIGGVPFYWSFMKRELGMPQNIDQMFFAEDAPLKREFGELYSSLFRSPENYIDVVTALGKKKIGMTREEIVENAGIKVNGNLTTILEDLEHCGFIRSYNQLGNKTKGTVFQLVDFYTLFYFKFIAENERKDHQFWSRNLNSQIKNVWCGLAFERVCLMHVSQIKRALSIGGVLSSEYSWRSPKNKLSPNEKGVQIDLLIDRDDDVIDICEMKYYSDTYELDDEEYSRIQNRILRLSEFAGPDKAIHIVLITTKGLKRTPNADIVQNVVTTEDLFR